MGYKALPKDPSDHKVVQLKGWPKLTWYQTDSCPKPPKEWIPPSRQSPHSTAYVEVFIIGVSTFLVILNLYYNDFCFGLERFRRGFI